MPWARSFQYQRVCKILSKHSKQIMSYGHFSQTVWGQNLHHKLSGDGHIFKIWSSAKPRPMLNAILQSHGLDLVNININVSAKFSQTVRGQNLRKLSGDGLSDYRADSKSQPSASLSVDFLRVVQYCAFRNTDNTQKMKTADAV